MSRSGTPWGPNPRKTMPDHPTPTETARRRELLDALGKSSELHYQMLLVTVLLLSAQGLAAAWMDRANILLYIALVITVATLGARLWVFQDQLASIRMRLKPLLDGDQPNPDAKTKQQLDWLTHQDPWLERVSVWGLFLGAALFAGGCLI